MEIDNIALIVIGAGIVPMTLSIFMTPHLDIAAIIDGFSLKYLPCILQNFSYDFSLKGFVKEYISQAEKYS